WDGEPVRPPTPLAGHARALLAFAALGGPRDSIEALEREIARVAASRVEPAAVDRVRDALLYLPATLAFPEMGARPVHAARGRDFALVGAQRALAAGDTAAVRAFARRVEESTRRQRPGLVAIDASYQIAWLLRAIGDTAGAARRLTLTLDALPTLTTAMLDIVPQAGAVGRAMALRAELAAAAGDRAVAARWGRATAELWSNADPELQPIVRRMRALAAGTPPR
ncbi:MAG TPA: hypothetical protein VFS05_10270, partial [Gemmatimonadaceae bacterium]|nr:hypothetical protein [Gemmatimonadaceae bacterium]